MAKDTGENKKNGSRKSDKKKKDFLVVGLGASAGGVKALQEFFAAMPSNSGMAFVVILHLAPDHESSLPQILQAQTAMPVTQVNETYKVEPNRVYVISPNHQLEMVDGIIRPAEVKRPHGSRIAIDTFFRTLAEAYERNAVCIVLSGTGSDGTLGLKRVKESNGFAIVQDPNDAEYDGMPRSAIETHLADWVLPVSVMPEKLLGFRDSSQRLHLTDTDDSKISEEIRADESLREILTLLRIRTGHDFSNYKTPTLVRRIARHLQIHELQDIPTYLNLLRDNPDEVQSLLKNLLINVTNFFRDRPAFDVIESKVVPNICAGKTSKDTIRIWSAGCASGEEAYSLAMLFGECAAKQSDPPKIQIFATDVDDEAIAEAREHFYPKTIAADVSPERLKRFFVREGNFYRVRKELRETILFAPHNILRDPPFSRLDLVVCRNLLIYLNRETQERVLQIFHFALNTHGYLFLGSSESAENVAALFAPVDKKQRIYSRRPAQLSQISTLQMPVAGKWQVPLPVRKVENELEHSFTLTEAHYKFLGKYAPPSILVNQDFNILYMSESAGRYLRFAGGEPTSNLLKLISPDLLPDVRAALFAAQRERKSSDYPNIHTVIENEPMLINLIVRTADPDDEMPDSLLVIFDEHQPSAENRETVNTADRDEVMEAVISRLENTLRRTKQSLQATIEQQETSSEELKAANEELQAINEELRSASEELETSKEELQSVNEELTTVNHELKEKIEETVRANSDLQNLMAATEIATIFLDRELRIKLYTPAAQKLFNVTSNDIGRPLEHFTNKLQYQELEADAADVLQSLKTVEREIYDKNNRCYLARFHPYLTTDNRINGVVLNFIDISRRKQTEEALHRSEQRFRAIFNQTIAGIMLIDLTGQYTYVNDCFCEMTGYTRTELLKKRIEDVIDAEDLPRSLELFENLKQTGEPFTLEKRYRRKNDSILWVRNSVSLMRDEVEENNYIVAVSMDITERKANEESIRFQAHLLDMVEQAVIATDLDGKVTYWNKFAETLYGWTTNQAVGRNILELNTPAEATEHAEEIMANLRHGKSWSGEFLLRRRSGAMFTAFVISSPIMDGNENLIGMVGVSIDVSERKKIEENLRRSEERLRLIMERTADYAIIVTDPDGIIIDWNAGAEKIFGYAKEKIIGQNCSILFTPEDIKNNVLQKEMQTALKQGRAEDERWHLRKNGTRFYASGVMTPLADGEVKGFVKIARDMTEKLASENALREKETLQKLISGQEDERRRIARDLHDHLGQQMTALRLKLEKLKNMCGEDDVLCAEVAEADKIAAHLDADVDFLAWELRPASLDDLGLRMTLDNYVRSWKQHTGVKAEFHTTGMGKASFGYEIETNLYRIAQEAMNNIYKHAKAKNVSVLLEKRKNKIVLIVEDDGIGFNVQDKKTRRKGLGLIGMIERAGILGGELEIESKKGRGTTVFARVPADLRRMEEE